MDTVYDPIPVGTKVRIVDHVPPDGQDYPIWVSVNMDRCLGREGEVTFYFPPRRYPYPTYEIKVEHEGTEPRWEYKPNWFIPVIPTTPTPVPSLESYTEEYRQFAARARSR